MKRSHLYALLAALFLCFSSAQAALTGPTWPPQDAPETLEFARVLTLVWDAPTQRLNGVPLRQGELSHYELMIKDSAQQHAYTIPASSVSADHIVSATGEHCGVIRAVDTNGLASPWSEQVCADLRSGPGRMTLRLGGKE